MPICGPASVSKSGKALSLRRSDSDRLRDVPDWEDVVSRRSSCHHAHTTRGGQHQVKRREGGRSSSRWVSGTLSWSEPESRSQASPCWKVLRLLRAMPTASRGSSGISSQCCSGGKNASSSRGSCRQTPNPGAPPLVSKELAWRFNRTSQAYRLRPSYSYLPTWMESSSPSSVLRLSFSALDMTTSPLPPEGVASTGAGAGAACCLATGSQGVGSQARRQGQQLQIG